jgi:hypothetical protein
MTTCETLPLPGFEPMASDPLKPSAGASRAKTSRSLVRVQVLTESEAAYGVNMRVWLASFDRATSSWKTSGLSGVEDLPQFSETLPRSGMTLNGTLYLLPPLVRLIYASGSGSSPAPLSTPTASMGDRGGRGDLLQQLRGNNSPTGHYKALLPTPTTDMVTNRIKPYAQGGTPLTMALMPTPTVQDAEQAGGAGCIDRGNRGLSLYAAAKRGLLPSPGASDARNAADYSNGSRDHSPQLRHLGSGRLNPRFVESMMRLPQDWTLPD